MKNVTKIDFYRFCYFVIYVVFGIIEDDVQKSCNLAYIKVL